MSKRLPTPPGRERLTREQSKAQTRSRLLEAAQTLFAIKGYEGTAIDEIAEQAGYSRGAFYSNFRNKEDLMGALIHQAFDGDIAGLETMRDADPEGMPQLYQQYARRFADDPADLLWMLEFQLSVVRHPELRGEYVAQFKRLRSEVGQIIENTFRQQGHKKPEELRRFADVYIALQSGLSLYRLLDPDSVPESLFAEVFEALERGLAATDQGSPGGETKK